MLANRVEAKPLEELQVIYHGFTIRRRVQAIRPKPLIESSKLEHKLAVEKGSGDTLYLSLGDGAEARVAVDSIAALQGYGEVVESR